MNLKDGEVVKKINILLDHWIKHNQEHAGEYKKWAEKLEKEGLEDISQHLKQASELVIQSNGEFILAKEKLGDIER